MQSIKWTRGKFVGKILLFFTSVLIPNVVCICNFVFCNFKKCHRTTSPGWPWTRWLTTPRSSAKYFRSPTGIRSASAVLQIPYRYTIHSAVLKYKIFFSFNVLASGELIQHNLYFTVPVKHHYTMYLYHTLIPLSFSDLSQTCTSLIHTCTSLIFIPHSLILVPLSYSYLSHTLTSLILVPHSCLYLFHIRTSLILVFLSYSYLPHTCTSHTRTSFLLVPFSYIELITYLKRKHFILLMTTLYIQLINYDKTNKSNITGQAIEKVH